MNTGTRLAVVSLVVSAAALVGIASEEAYRGIAYQDDGGVWTLGFGETSGVKPGDRTTPERALVQLLKSAGTHADAIRQCIHVPLHQHEFDAYLSLAYNIGSGAFCRSTLVKKLNERQYAQACGEIRKWIYVSGKPSCGLIRRREREYRMCMGEKP